MSPNPRSWVVHAALCDDCSSWAVVIIADVLAGFALGYVGPVRLDDENVARGLCPVGKTAIEEYIDEHLANRAAAS
jgi:hypothetical protein